MHDYYLNYYYPQGQGAQTDSEDRAKAGEMETPRKKQHEEGGYDLPSVSPLVKRYRAGR
jgi:hypothetical protein